ncbi:MAG: FAD-dependent oxidoreductase, partial [Pseudomonadota bacterium]
MAEVTNGSVTNGTLGNYPDLKFVGGTWLDFYEQYILPSIASFITYNTAVNAIDYSGGQVTVSTSNGNFTADRVILTVPVKLLQGGAISFTPALPSARQSAINNVVVWDGIKIFIEFS